MSNEYMITGIKEWSLLYWQGTFAWCNSKERRHRLTVFYCLQSLEGKDVVLGLHRQYGYTAAMKEAEELHSKGRTSEEYKSFIWNIKCN